MVERKSKAVIILSGGMDSTTLLYEMKSHNFDVRALSFDYNQKHKRELELAKATCAKLDVPHKILNLGILNEIAPSALTRDDWQVPEGNYADENMKQTVVPNRNMVMLSLAGAYAIGEKAKYLCYGAHAGDHTIYPDCRPAFVDAIRKTLRLADWNSVELHAPYLMLDKGDIVKRGLKLGVDYKLTLTCYKGLEKACGKCGSCTERLEAFQKAGVEDPIEYESR